MGDELTVWDLMEAQNAENQRIENQRAEETVPAPLLSGNRGEWSEIYIFLKLAEEGKVYAADTNMQKVPDTYLDIIRIIREEIAGRRIDYYPGEELSISINDVDTSQRVSNQTLSKYSDIVWFMINGSSGNGLQNREVEQFLNEIFINKLKSPAVHTTGFFGGTCDIMMEVSDYKTGIVSSVGFSCKSKKATLFNASMDNTNFIFRISNMDDEKMKAFNKVFKIVNKPNKETGIKEPKEQIATNDRIKYLKDSGCDLSFVSPAKPTCGLNLIRSGGMEMPVIVAAMLKCFYFQYNGSADGADFSTILQYLVETDPANYKMAGFKDLENVYRTKISKLLYDMFTGMRLGTEWDGRADVNGGYIVVNTLGEVLAYHTCIVDEFKDFLFDNLKLEGPDNKRHHSMQIYKEGDEYFIKFALQVRFSK